MIKANKAGYYYNGKEQQDDASYNINEEYMDELENAHKYGELADYMEQFHMTDINRQRNWQSAINTYRREGAIAEQVYNNARLKGPKVAEAIEFNESIFNPNAMQTITTNNSISKWNEYKRNLGSNFDDNGIRDEATTLEFTFQPQVRNAFGDGSNTNGFWGTINDYLMPDNNANIDNFCSILGVTEKDLEAAGVQISKDTKTGTTSIKFDKANDFANKLIYAAGSLTRQGKNGSIFDNDIKIQGYKLNGEPIQFASGYNEPGSSVSFTGNRLGKNKEEIALRNLSDLSIHTSRITPEGHYRYEHGSISDTPHSVDGLTPISTLARMANMIDASKDISDQNFADIVDEPKVYQTQLYGYISPAFEEYCNARRQGLVSNQEYNAETKSYFDKIENQIRGFASGLGSYNQGIVMSNIEDGEWGEEMHEVNLKDKNTLAAWLTTVINEGNYSLQTATFGTKVGTYITLYQKSKDKNDDNEPQKPRVIFVENLFIDEINKQLDRDNNIRAMFDLNDMETYGYDKKLSNGDKLSIARIPNSDAYAYYTTSADKTVTPLGSRDEAIKLLATSIGIQQVQDNLIYNFINQDGDVLNPNAYRAKAMDLALNMINNIYNDNNIITPEDIISPFIDRFDKNGNPIKNEEGNYNLSDLPMFKAFKVGKIFDAFNEMCKPLYDQMRFRGQIN